MKKIFYILCFFIFTSTSFADNNTECEGVMAKLKKDCNILGKSMDKMKDFSKKNKTINQSIDKIKKKIQK